MNIKIEPVPVGFKEMADNVKLIQGDYVLGSNSSCRCKVEFYKGSDIKFVDEVEIPEDMIQTWGEDDEPLIEYVLDNLGLIQIPPPPMEEEPIP